MYGGGQGSLYVDKVPCLGGLHCKVRGDNWIMYELVLAVWIVWCDSRWSKQRWRMMTFGTTLGAKVIGVTHVHSLGYNYCPCDNNNIIVHENYTVCIME